MTDEGMKTLWIIDEVCFHAWQLRGWMKMEKMMKMMKVMKVMMKMDDVDEGDDEDDEDG